MGRKVFVSYKYGDTQVKDLNIYEVNLWGISTKVQTKVRHYVDKLSELLEDGDHIYKGESDGTSLADFSDEYIASALRNKIFDSTVTVVLVSKGFKNSYLAEADQWIPWEISYSLRESSRNGRISSSNGVVAVVLPDEWGSYEYFITTDLVCDCRSLNTPFLFKILRDNMFNAKAPVTSTCSNGSIVYYGDSSYIQSVKWEDFVRMPSAYLDKAVEIKDNKENYNITKRL